MVFSNGLLFGASADAGGGGGGFDTTLIPNSIQLNGTDEKFSRNTSSWDTTTAGGKRCVMACWVQLCKIPLTANQGFMFLGGTSGSGTDQVGLFFSYDVNPIEMDLYMYCNGKSFIPLMAFRDVGWYHILASYDLNETGTDKGKLFVNGIEITENFKDERSSFGSSFTNVTVQEVGGFAGGSSFPGYIAQPVMLQNASIQDSDVAITDFVDAFTFGTNGSQFVPKADADIAALATSAGGNSFCLDFTDSTGTNAVNLGLDISDRDNDLTPENMAAGNQSTNTPSKVYAIMDVLKQSGGDSSTIAFSNGNLTVTGSGGDDGGIFSTLPLATTGTTEFQATFNNGDGVVGICCYDNLLASASSASNNVINGSSSPYNAAYGYKEDGNKVVVLSSGATTSSQGDALTTNSVVTVRYNADDNEITFLKDNVAQGSAVSTVANLTYYAFIARESNYNITMHFEEGKFPNTIGTGNKTLSSSKLGTPANQGIDFFNVVGYTGNGSTNNITGTGFQPDLVAIKSKTNASPNDWGVYDAVRGTEKQLSFNQPANSGTASEEAESTGLTAFGSDGFSIGALAEINTSSATFAAYQWLGQNGTTSIGASGSRLASTVSVSAAGNFSIVSWEGSGANATVGHGLSVAPELVFYKNRETADNWVVYCNHLSSDDHFLLLDDVAESNTDGSTYFNSDGPTASVLNLGSNTASGASDKATNKAPGTSGDKNMIAYCFASIAGVCKVGVYEGNNNIIGPYVSLGFTPATIIWKNIDATTQWPIVDNNTNSTNSGNPFVNWMLVDSNGTRGGSGSYDVDFLADGFKPRLTSNGYNQNTVIYLAMADIGGNGTLPPIYGR